MTSKILIDAEVSLSQEDFLLFKDAAETLKMSIGDTIISCARHRATEILEIDTAKEDPTNARSFERTNQEDECEQTSKDRLI